MIFDTTLLHAVSITGKNTFFDWLMPALSDMHRWIIPLAVTLIGLAILGRKKGLQTVLLLILAVALTDAVCGNILKPLFARPRPLSGDPTSFPSNHTANCFAFLTVMAWQYRKYFVIIPVAIIAVAVGYSRLYLSAHYPTDVFGGAVIGAIIAYAVIRIYFMILQHHKRKKDGNNLHTA
jgi:undecaprenyl-diphosphatase